ncbi:putative nuclease HARBI1 isoform X1 [Leptinotarsa decemlineata]|uniref:putative nuclease HARBI1 isoform X1 n=2 Tax=Leptinotarsa decemlineata TaxID=7539 RepID=UPI003D304117
MQQEVFLITIGDYMHVSKSSASNIIKKVSSALALLALSYIMMPRNENEVSFKRIQFYNKASLPRVIGSLDCTHIKIQSPGKNNAELFRNQKGYFSINVQTVSSTDLKIMDLVARWPGSTHDQTIFDHSNLKRRLENGEFGNSLLVADSGYVNTQHIITPLLTPGNEVEQLYNESVTRTKNPVERQYGVSKRRFTVLALGLQLKLETAQTVIVAVGVLHNIAIDKREQEPPLDQEVNLANIIYVEDTEVDPPDHNINNAREILLNEYFPASVRERREI